MRLISESDYLAHHGIKGQRWGVRRYQNEDGSLTEAGKRRYSSGYDYDRDVESEKRYRRSLGKKTSDIDTKALFSQTIKGGKDKPNKSPAEVISSEVGKTAGNLKQGYRSAKAIANGPKEVRRSRLSDDELRRRVNRLELEKRYRDLSSRDVDRGEYYVNNILDLTESIAGIAVSAATVYALINSVKK